MRNTIDISVIIPAYNADNYIEECMDSVLRQNDINIEILAVDDGSTDRTGEILDTYAERYDNVRFYHKENGGVSSARNAALQCATGKYVCYLDSDDYYVTGALRQAFEMCEEKEADVLFMMYRNFYDNELAEADYPVKDIKQEMRSGRYPENPVSGLDLLDIFKKNKEYNVMVCMQMVRRDLLERNRIHFENGIIFEDAPYTLSVLLHAQRAIAWNKNLFNYRIRNNSLCHRPADAERCYGAFKGLLYMMEYVRTVGTIPEANVAAVASELRRRYRFTTRTFIAIDKLEREKLRELFSSEEYVFFEVLVRTYGLLDSQKKKEMKKNEKCLEEINRQQEELEILRSQLKDKENENNQIRNSWTFKIGKRIVAPLSKIKKLVK